MRWIITGLLCLLALPAGAEVHERELENGLKVLVQVDERAPTVVSQIWYPVGSSYEHGGITGSSHVLEHMMFKGTDEVGPGEFSRIIREQGGRENAFTGRDYTAYFEQLAADRLAIALELEADRMTNLLLDEAEFRKEVEVVKEERRLRTEDQPGAKLREAFNAAAWQASPYGNPVIGWMNDLENMTLEDMERWYARFYHPGNAILVVVGAVEPEAVFDAAERHFGDLEAGPDPEVKPRREPEQQGPRRVTVRDAARVPQVRIGYKVPSLKTAEVENEAYALEVAAGLLAGGDSARLQRRLVREDEVVSSASAHYGLYDRLETLFLLTGTPTAEGDVETTEAALRDEAGALARGDIDDAELERVKAQVVASEIYQRDSTFYQAMRLGLAETVGLGRETVLEYADRIEAVTADDVRAVAERYFTDDRLTVGILEPTGEDGEMPRRPGNDGGLGDAVH